MASDSISYPGVVRPAGFDSVIQKAMVEEDWNKRKTLLMKMEKLLYDDVFLVPILEIPFLTFRTPDLK